MFKVHTLTHTHTTHLMCRKRQKARLAEKKAFTTSIHTFHYITSSLWSPAICQRVCLGVCFIFFLSFFPLLYEHFHSCLLIRMSHHWQHCLHVTLNVCPIKQLDAFHQFFSIIFFLFFDPLPFSAFLAMPFFFIHRSFFISSVVFDS